MDVLTNAWSHIWTGVRYWSFKFLSYLSARLPLRFGYVVGSLIGDIGYLFFKKHSANAVSNMRRVMGESADWQVVKETARDSFRNYFKTLVDFARFPHLTPTQINSAISTQQGWDVLAKGLERGNGILAMSGHIGNWDMAGALLGSTGVPVYAVADTFEPKKIDDLINGARERAGVRIIKLETHSLRQIFSALKKNEIVLLLVDKPEPDEGVAVQFFGETAYLPPGPAAIALKTRAMLMFGYCARRRGDKKFTAVVEPIEYEHLLTGDKEKDIQIITQQIVSRMEEVIRRYPDQWYMFRQMWPRTHRNDEEIRRRRFWGGGKPTADATSS